MGLPVGFMDRGQSSRLVPVWWLNDHTHCLIIDINGG